MTSFRDRSALRPYQTYLADLIEEKECLLLAVEMGLGKTAATLTAIRRLLDFGEVTRVLIIAPLRVANDTWPDEIEAWSHARLLTYEVLTGSDEQRRQRAARPADIHIVNRENVPWLVEHLGEAWPYDMVVWDESSGLKSWKKRTPNKSLTRFGAMAKARKHVKRFVELTGTPSPNGIIDLGGQIYMLDGGQRLGTSRSAYEKRWFEADYMGWNLKPRPNAEKEIMGLISDVMVGLRAEDYIAMPEVIMNTVHVDLPPKVMKEYRQFERTLVADAYDVEAVSRGVLTNKLLQFANGSLYQEGEVDPVTLRRKRGPDVPVHEEKLKALDSIIEEAAGENILLAYSFRFDLARIRKRYPSAVVFDEEPDAVKLWNAGKIRLLLAHPASVGHGLNLQHGGHIAVWYGMTWSLELYQQFNKRLPRPGQLHPVVIHHIIARDTMDETALTVMSNKEATQDAVTNSVRVRLLTPR